MGVIADELQTELSQPEFSEGYADSFLNSYIATQIKVLRQQRGMTQLRLADALETKQAVVSRIENVNYSNWSMSTLKKLAHAFEVRLKVSFEEFGTLPDEVEGFAAEGLRRAPRSRDPRLLRRDTVTLQAGAARAANPVTDISEHRNFRRNNATGAAAALDLHNSQAGSQASAFERRNGTF